MQNPKIKCNLCVHSSKLVYFLHTIVSQKSNKACFTMISIFIFALGKSPQHCLLSKLKLHCMCQAHSELERRRFQHV